MIQRFLAGIFVVASLAHASNLVGDSGFETPGVLAGANAYTTNLGDGFWNITQGGIQIADTAFGEGAVPHSGNQFAYLDFGNSPNTLSQTLATVIGQSYTVSYWVADTVANTVVVNFGDQNLFTGTAPTAGVGSSTDYVDEIFNVTADSVSTNLTITGQWVGGDNNFGTILDDVSVTPNSSAPEPATIAFTALGLAALSSMLRRPLKTPAPRG